MRPEVPIFRDEKRGQLRARFQELKEEGKRAPTFNLCSLGEFDYAPSGRPRSEPQKQIYEDQMVTGEDETGFRLVGSVLWVSRGLE